MRALFVALAASWPVQADEGMWTFDNLPLKQLKEKYGFEPSKEWIEHLRSSAVRFNSGGSGSFVSADGLVMTNHHVGADTLHKISTKDKDYYKDGFWAKTQAEEVRAPDLELNVLVDIQDVTARVTEVIQAGMDDAAASVAKRKRMAEIEKEATERNKLRNDVITLYQGGQYHLYTYKKYTDVRLVFAPEFAIAFFGGDPDNFEYPRYDLDCCFFRVYEDSKPAKITHYLKWSPSGCKDGELTFVAGNPGRTNRLNTLAHLEFLRDVAYPLTLKILRDREANLTEYSQRGPEQARQASEELFIYANSRKARTGGLEGLRDKAFLERKAKQEAELRARIDADPKKKAAYGDAWDKIAAAQKVSKEIIRKATFLEGGRGHAIAFDSRLFEIARMLVRLAAEKEKPNSDRLREYRESNLASLELDLYSKAPIYPELEKAKLARSLTLWKEMMGDDPLVARVLHGRSPAQVANQLVDGTRLADVDYRKDLAKGGLPAIEQSNDPMIKLALAVDAEARAVRKRQEEEVEGVLTAQYARIAKAIFEELGSSVYPDATFTLRLAFGTVKGYEVNGKTYPPFTTIGGAFEHAAAHGNKPPYELPPSWFKAKAEGRLRLDTPLNFVSTADIIGGNSGSPVVNRDNEVVGLIFDGNIQSLILDFGYDEKVARAISVDSRAIIEAIRSIYHADPLAEELMRGHR
jgi:hypothetical protein